MWLNKKEAADYLRISTRTITRYANCPVNPLPHSFVSNRMMFHKADLDAWITFDKPFHKCTRNEIDIIKGRLDYEQ